jgi:hypothetical protein
MSIADVFGRKKQCRRIPSQILLVHCHIEDLLEVLSEMVDGADRQAIGRFLSRKSGKSFRFVSTLLPLN